MIGRKKIEDVQDDADIIDPQDMDVYTQNLAEAISQMPDNQLAQITANLERTVNEDYRSNSVTLSSVEEIPPVITTLTDLVDVDENGDIQVKKDHRGVWIDISGSKGNIPSWAMAYNQSVNLATVLLGLEEGCYEYEYERDTYGNVKRENGCPIVKNKKCVSLAVELRNYANLNNLAVNANRATLQAKIFAGHAGASAVGYDNGFDEKLFNMMGGRRR